MEILKCLRFPSGSSSRAISPKLVSAAFRASPGSAILVPHHRCRFPNRLRWAVHQSALNSSAGELAPGNGQARWRGPARLAQMNRNPNAIYFVWGRTDEEIEAILADAAARGDLGPSDPNACILWSGRGLPASGWQLYRDLTELEDEALDANVRAVAEEGRLREDFDTPQVQLT